MARPPEPIDDVARPKGLETGRRPTTNSCRSRPLLLTTERRIRNGERMGNIEIVSESVEEQPHYFDFIKNDFIGTCPGMATLNYDPFPDKQIKDVVRTEIIARKLVLHVRLKGDVLHIRPGIVLKHKGHDFAVKKSVIHIDTKGDNSIADVEGEAFLAPPEPMKILAQLRQALAKR